LGKKIRPGAFRKAPGPYLFHGKISSLSVSSDEGGKKRQTEADIV
jgi:hypothetical protein